MFCFNFAERLFVNKVFCLSGDGLVSGSVLTGSCHPQTTQPSHDNRRRHRQEGDLRDPDGIPDPLLEPRGLCRPAAQLPRGAGGLRDGPRV